MVMNLKKKIVLYILPVAVLSFTLTVFIVSREARKSLLKESYAGIKMVGEQAAADIHFKTSIALRDAVTLSKTPAVIAHAENMAYDMKEEAEVARKDIEAYFSEFLERAQIYSRLLYIDPQGNPIVDKGRVKGAEKAWTALIQSVPQLKAGKPSILPAAYEGNNYAIHFLVPALNKKNDPLGFILLDLDWNLVLQDLQKIKIGQSGYVLIADRLSGKALCYPPDPAQILSMDFRSLPIGERILQSQNTHLDYTHAGQKWSAYATAVAGTDWTLAAVIPWHEILSAVSDLNQKIILIALFGILLICVFVWFFGRSIMSRLEKIIEGTSLSADQTASSSDQIASASQNLAERTSEQAASLEEVSSSLEQLSSMTQNNADNASQGASLIQETSQIIVKANDAMLHVTASMDNISRASEQTAKIVKTIDEIAFQTNLLALNAAVEAARAGEAGAGFAIVADEVRNLAQRSAEAAKNSSDLIQDITGKVKAGVSLVNATNETFGHLSQSITKMENLINEIAVASKEQAQGITQINTSINQMDKVTQSNAGSAEETASASAEMCSLAAKLRDMVAELKDVVGGTK